MTGADAAATAASVDLLRRLAARHRASVGALLVLALAIRLLVPAGFMPRVADGHISIGICSGVGPMTVMAMPGSDHGKSDDGAHGKPGQPCAFAALSAPALPAADPILVALAMLFVAALALQAAAKCAAVAPRHLRPPLRGPPPGL